MTILDTAGLRETEDFVEKIGIDRALDRAEKADLRVFLKSTVEEQLPIELRSGDIEMLGKADLFVGRTLRSVSGKTGEGVDHLVDRYFKDAFGSISQRWNCNA